MLTDGIELAISPVQERVKGSPGKRGVTLTPQTSGDVGLRREPAHIPNISKHISFQTTDKYSGVHDRLNALDEAGLIYWPTIGEQCQASSDTWLPAPGRTLQDIILDITQLGARSRERTGYPTQKPSKLIERIIKASSNRGDVVLDPFCGCATTCIAAEKLGRQWVGIDISPRAVELVRYRLERELGLDEREGIFGDGHSPHRHPASV